MRSVSIRRRWITLSFGEFSQGTINCDSDWRSELPRETLKPFSPRLVAANDDQVFLDLLLGFLACHLVSPTRTIGYRHNSIKSKNILRSVLTSY